VVVPAHQHRGLGSRIVAALTAYVESVPFTNTWGGLFPVEGTAQFYARFGYKAQRPSGAVRRCVAG
jgi:GNAT superfamily N-acetyltransferase